MLTGLSYMLKTNPISYYLNFKMQLTFIEHLVLCVFIFLTLFLGSCPNFFISKIVFILENVNNNQYIFLPLEVEPGYSYVYRI
jgi:hypothetical protein